MVQGRESPRRGLDLEFRGFSQRFGPGILIVCPEFKNAVNQGLVWFVGEFTATQIPL